MTLSEKMHFVGRIGEHQVDIDTTPRGGGENRGPSPKALTLTALAGCTAMDVIGILRKMRAEPEAFSVEAEADVTDTNPKVFSRVHLTYRIKGKVPREKVERAVRLSQDTYCGVSAMLRKAVPIDWSIEIEE